MQLCVPMRRRARLKVLAPMCAAVLGAAACSGAGTSAGATMTAAAHPASAAATAASTAVPSRLAPVTIAAVGDTMLGNTPELPPQPGRYLDLVKPELAGDAVPLTGPPCQIRHAAAAARLAGRITYRHHSARRW